MAKPVAIFTSIWTIIQSIIYLVVTILGFQAYQCNIDMTKGNIVNQIMHIVYFNNVDCGYSPDMSMFDNLTYLKPIIDTTAPSAVRTNDWMVVYISLSSISIFTSLLLFIGAVMNSPRKVFCFFVFPWILVSTMMLIADLTASIIYALDIKETITFAKLFYFLKINFTLSDIPLPPGITLPPGIIDEELNKIDFPYTWIPSLVMVAFFSRLVLFWIINFVLLICVTVEASRVHKGLPANNQGNVKVAPANVPQTVNPNEVNAIPRRFQTQPSTTSYEGVQQNGIRPMSVDRLNSTYSTSAQSDIYSYPHYDRTESWLGKKGEGMQSNLKTSSDLRMNSARPLGNDELRSQLPWSYFQDRSEPPRTAPRPYADGDLPPVPVPDYTLHFPKRRREGEIDRGKSSKSTTPSPPPVHPRNNSGRLNEQKYDYVNKRY